MPFRSLDATFPICDVDHDMGAVVKAVFDLGPKANGKVYPIVGEFIKVTISRNPFGHHISNTSQTGDVAKEFEKGEGSYAKCQLTASYRQESPLRLGSQGRVLADH